MVNTDIEIEITLKEALMFTVLRASSIINLLVGRFSRHTSEYVNSRSILQKSPLSIVIRTYQEISLVVKRDGEVIPRVQCATLAREVDSISVLGVMFSQAATSTYLASFQNQSSWQYD